MNLVIFSGLCLLFALTLGSILMMWWHGTYVNFQIGRPGIESKDQETTVEQSEYVGKSRSYLSPDVQPTEE
jgi:hypothetical protein